MASLVISRPAGRYRDRLRRYRLVLDQKIVGDIGAGEEIAVAVGSGTHTLRARIDWTGSPVVDFMAEGDQTVRFDVRPAGSALVGIVQMISTTRYLKLMRV